MTKALPSAKIEAASSQPLMPRSLTPPVPRPAASDPSWSTPSSKAPGQDESVHSPVQIEARAYRPDAPVAENPHCRYGCLPGCPVGKGQARNIQGWLPAISAEAGVGVPSAFRRSKTICELLPPARDDVGRRPLPQPVASRCQLSWSSPWSPKSVSRFPSASNLTTSDLPAWRSALATT